MKAKTLIIIDTYDIGGPGKLILQFLKNGGNEACSPIVAGFRRGPERKWQFREAIESINVRFEVLLQRFAFDPSAIIAAYRLVRDNDIQILESHGYKAHVVCLTLSKLLHIPWVAYVHGWTRENLKVRMYNLLEERIVPFADRIVPVSKNLGSLLNLKKHDREKLVTIPNAVEPADMTPPIINVRKQLGVLEEETLIGVIGRLSPEKGHRYFVEAFKEIQLIVGNVKAVFVGDGQEFNALDSFIQECGFVDKIFLVGYQEDVARYYHACDIVVLPSLSEGMPMAALEAMSFAKSVIATNVGGIPEVVIHGETGLLVEPQNHNALAEALIVLLCDRQRMENFGWAGKKRIEGHFDPRERVKSIIGLYKLLLD